MAVLRPGLQGVRRLRRAPDPLTADRLGGRSAVLAAGRCHAVVIRETRGDRRDTENRGDCRGGGRRGTRTPGAPRHLCGFPGRHPVPRRAGARRRGSGDVPRSRREDPRRGPPADQDGHIGRPDSHFGGQGAGCCSGSSAWPNSPRSLSQMSEATLVASPPMDVYFPLPPPDVKGVNIPHRNFGVRPSSLRVRPRWRRAADPTWSGAFGRVSSGRRRGRRGRCRRSAGSVCWRLAGRAS